MTGPSRHTYTFDLPIRVGEGEGADTCHVKVIADFNLVPDPKAPMLDVIEARIVDGDWEPNDDFITLLERVQEYLDDGGYDAALASARADRPWVDWE